MVKVEIKYCSKCPYGKVLPDPDPNDWFCDDDEKVYCSKLRREVIGALRPYEVGKLDTPPKDCPYNEG